MAHLDLAFSFVLSRDADVSGVKEFLGAPDLKEISAVSAAGSVACAATDLLQLK